ncbi:MAG: hypothetical protein MZV63_31280 [Marinilabiliales bacterium]|nr:hypothetical protein [Marinilabiliales bacterium]
MAGRAKDMGSRFGHIGFFLAFYAGNLTIVFHADQQSSATVLAKAENVFAGIADFELEIKVLVFTLTR